MEAQYLKGGKGLKFSEIPQGINFLKADPMIFSLLFAQVKAVSKRSTKAVHPWHGLEQPADFPETVTVVIEIPSGSSTKTEIDHETGVLKFDRPLYGSLTYPENYGMLPITLGGDGDPLDCFVICDYPLYPLTVLQARPIGIIPTIDNGEEDNKIVLVPISDPYMKNITEIEQIPQLKIDRVVQFLNQYKFLERKTVNTKPIEDSFSAKKELQRALKQYADTFGTPEDL